MKFRVSGLPPMKLVKRVESALAELETLAKAGDEIAVREFERLLSALGSKHRDMLWQRAKDGDKSLNHFSSIWELLGIADDEIEHLGWLAKHRSKDCERFAVDRLTWPGFISILPSIESKSQALKLCIPLGRDYEHYDKRRTKADAFFRAARFTIKFFKEGGALDSGAGIYYVPWIEGVEFMFRPEREQKIKSYLAQLGPMTRGNWPNWKPVFERFITFHYGPSHERWKLMPDSQLPPAPPEIKGKKIVRPDLIAKTYRERFHTSYFWGTLHEWYEHLVNHHQLSAAERAEVKQLVNRHAAGCIHRCIMDIKPDAALQRVHNRAKKRNSGWSEFKNEILNRCERLLPKA